MSIKTSVNFVLGQTQLKENCIGLYWSLQLMCINITLLKETLEKGHENWYLVDHAKHIYKMIFGLKNRQLRPEGNKLKSCLAS